MYVDQLSLLVASADGKHSPFDRSLRWWFPGNLMSNSSSERCRVLKKEHWGIYVNWVSTRRSVNHFIARWVSGGTRLTHFLALPLSLALNKYCLHVMDKIKSPLAQKKKKKTLKENSYGSHWIHLLNQRRNIETHWRRSSPQCKDMRSQHMYAAHKLN